MSKTVDMEKVIREQMRWLILEALNAGRPIGCADVTVLSSVQGVIENATMLDVRREMAYLRDRDLIKIEGRGLSPIWHTELTHHGVDVVEYAVPCYPGIARPKKWW